jgi:hypothetical protein
MLQVFWPASSKHVIRVFQVVLGDTRMAVDGLDYQILTSNFPMLSN